MNLRIRRIEPLRSLVATYSQMLTCPVKNWGYLNHYDVPSPSELLEAGNTMFVCSLTKHQPGIVIDLGELGLAIITVKQIIDDKVLFAIDADQSVLVQRYEDLKTKIRRDDMDE